MTHTTDTAASPTFDFAKWQAEERARTEQLDAIRPKNKAALFDALAVADITTVTVEFHGYGDSGGIEDVSAARGDTESELPTQTIALLTIPWRQTEPVENEVTVFAAIEHMVYELLGQTHGG